MKTLLLSIGQLARRVGVRTSTLRYYEAEGLLTPAGRTDAGYRLYAPEAEKTLRFIQRTQRLGFSLSDIRTLLQSTDLSTVVALAEERFLALESRLTELLVLRHELELVLEQYRDEMGRQDEPNGDQLIDRLLERVCTVPPEQSSVQSTLEWLMELSGCNLSGRQGQALLEVLRGQHVHIWQTENAYQILVVGHDARVEAALRELAHLETGCHIHPPLTLSPHPEGYLLTATGDSAFVYARLFLMLEDA